MSDVIYYFKGQRCSGPRDQADRTMRFEGKDGVVDVHGGWFDASGDYGKPLTHLSFKFRNSTHQASPDSRNLNALESVPGVLDERVAGVGSPLDSKELLVGCFGGGAF